MRAPAQHAAAFNGVGGGMLPTPLKAAGWIGVSSAATG
jgi:hypothetical protein